MRKATPTLAAPVRIQATPTSSQNASQPAVSPSAVHYHTTDNQHLNHSVSSITSSQTLGLQSLGNSPAKTHSPHVIEGDPPQQASAYDPPLRDSFNDAPAGNSPSAQSDQSSASANAPTQTSTACGTPSRVQVGVVIAVSLVTVFIHVVMCLWTHRTFYHYLSNWYDKKVRSKLSRTPPKKRRRRKRKQYFVPLTQESSTDCSI